MAYEKESLHDMIYGENHKLADSMPYNNTLDKLYGFPKEMHTGLEIEMIFYYLKNKSQPSCSHMFNI